MVEQLKARGYADKYRSTGKPNPPDRGGVFPPQRQIVAFEVESAQ
ncbi:hypothetical protein [Halomonas halodenitrificans]|nr:hypothetical protein [Halomonas halodenitrificans]